MAINFNSLPQEQPSAFAVIPAGLYHAKIVKTDMKQGKDTSKPPYLNLQLNILNEAKERITTIWETLAESTSDLMGYKIRRMCEAAGLNLSGEVELADLGKMLADRELRVFLTIDTYQGKERNIVDINQDGIFLPANNTNNLSTPESDNGAEGPDKEAPKVQY